MSIYHYLICYYIIYSIHLAACNDINHLTISFENELTFHVANEKWHRSSTFKRYLFQDFIRTQGTFLSESSSTTTGAFASVDLRDYVQIFHWHSNVSWPQWFCVWDRYFFVMFWFSPFWRKKVTWCIIQIQANVLVFSLVDTTPQKLRLDPGSWGHYLQFSKSKANAKSPIKDNSLTFLRQNILYHFFQASYNLGRLEEALT